MMTTATTQIYRVYIKAKPEAVWDAITKPEWTERYGYGGQADYDLRPGGHHRGGASEGRRARGAPGGARPTERPLRSSRHPGSYRRGGWRWTLRWLLKASLV